MIVIARQNPSWIHVVLHFKGSIISRIWRRVLGVFLISLATTAAHLGYFGAEAAVLVRKLEITVTPFTLIGLAVSIYLGFRNNASYDRFWEGRKLWGRMVNVSRTITRQIMTLIAADPAVHKELVYRVMAYVHAFRMHLRDERDHLTQLGPFLPKEELQRFSDESNPPIAMLHELGERFAGAWRSGALDAFHLRILEESLTECAGIQGGCERIKATPIPFAYTVLMHRIVGIYCAFLPFGLVNTIVELTPIVVVMIAYAFFALDAIGDELESPFGYDLNDLPLNQLSRMIEINLRERLGEKELPDPVRPVDEVLT